MTDKPAGSPQVLSAARAFWRLSDHELARLLALVRQVDHVEHKFFVPEPAHEAACAALGVDLARARTRRVYFLDTDDLALERHGVVVRVRSRRHRPDDSVVKLRPVVPCRLPADLRRSGNFGVEVDMMPGEYVCSGALKRRLGPRAVERVMVRGGPLRTLFSERQRDLLAGRAPAHIAIDRLTVFGPVEERLCKISPDGFGGKFVVQQWTYPDGSTALELSTRSRAEKAPRSAALMAALLHAHDIDLTGPQQTKTRTTLDYFVRRCGGSVDDDRAQEGGLPGGG